MGQTSQTAFTTPFESFVSSTGTFPDFEVDVHHFQKKKKKKF